MVPSAKDWKRDPAALNKIERAHNDDFPRSDPRTFDAARMQSYHHDNTPKFSVSLKSMQKKYASSNYSGLSSIDKGHVSYYCGQITGNVFNPITHRPGMTVQSIFVDPNGISKPTYDIYPQRLTRESMDRKNESKLSYINDTALHREDIMASNLRTYNRQRFDTSFCQ